MRRKIAKTLKYTWGIAIGGASGAALPYMQSLLATGDISHIDLHKVGQTAMWGAILALLTHFAKSPVADKEPTPPPAQPVPPPYKNAPANLMEMK